MRIEVTDSGPGIPPEIRGRIFDPFFTTKPDGEGTGLGLALARGIVESHGGAIEVDCAPGEGARFVIELPVGTAPGPVGERDDLGAAPAGPARRSWSSTTSPPSPAPGRGAGARGP